jgi:hypothetical protein
MILENNNYLLSVCSEVASHSTVATSSSIFSTFGFEAITITSSVQFKISIFEETFKSETFILSQISFNNDKSTSKLSTKSTGKHLTSNSLINSSMIAHSEAAFEDQTKERGI